MCDPRVNWASLGRNRWDSGERQRALKFYKRCGRDVFHRQAHMVEVADVRVQRAVPGVLGLVHGMCVPAWMLCVLSHVCTHARTHAHARDTQTRTHACMHARTRRARRPKLTCSVAQPPGRPSAHHGIWHGQVVVKFAVCARHARAPRPAPHLEGPPPPHGLRVVLRTPECLCETFMTCRESRRSLMPFALRRCLVRFVWSYTHACVQCSARMPRVMRAARSGCCCD
jgi:hypothetical protein